MRALIAFLFCLTTALPIHAQEAGKIESEEEDSVEQTGTAFLDYLKGAALYEKGNYGAALPLLERSFKAAKTEDAGRYVYYALIALGHDLEAGAFAKKHPAYTFSVPPFSRGFESAYGSVGIRLSNDEAISGNLLYGNAGATFRLSPRARLWQDVSYLQDADPGRLKQYTSYTALPFYAGRKWMVIPVVQLAAVPYSLTLSERNDVRYSASYLGGSIRYETNAVQDIAYQIPGRSSFAHAALSFNKRLGATTLEAEPALHLVSGRNTLRYQYTSAGTTDSFVNGALAGSVPFRESGDGGRDTSFRYSVLQLGGSVTHQFTVGHVPLAVRAAGYFLQSGNTMAGAVTAYALVQANRKWWVHLNALRKGALPAAFNREALYLNYANAIAIRTSESLQLFPLQRRSVFFTYQYEQNSPLGSADRLTYHSLYFTFKYRL